MRLADYISQTLADFGMCHVFMLTGGRAMNRCGSNETPLIGID